MSIATISSKRQITIPVPIFRALRLTTGEYLDARVEDNRIVLTPQRLIPKEDAWFWSPEWQAGEKEADKDIRDGRVSGPYKSVVQFMRGLKKKNAKRSI